MQHMKQTLTSSHSSFLVRIQMLQIFVNLIPCLTGILFSPLFLIYTDIAVM